MAVTGPSPREIGAAQNQQPVARTTPLPASQPQAAVTVAAMSLNRTQGAPRSKPVPEQQDLEKLGERLDAIAAKNENKMSGFSGFAWNLRLAWALFTGDTQTRSKMMQELKEMHHERQDVISTFKNEYRVSGDLMGAVRQAQEQGRIQLEAEERMMKAEAFLGQLQNMKKACDQVDRAVDREEGQSATRRHYRKGGRGHDHFKLLKQSIEQDLAFLKEYQKEPTTFTAEQVERKFSSIQKLIEAFHIEKKTMDECSRVDMRSANKPRKEGLAAAAQTLQRAIVRDMR